MYKGNKIGYSRYCSNKPNTVLPPCTNTDKMHITNYMKFKATQIPTGQSDLPCFFPYGQNFETVSDHGHNLVWNVRSHVVVLALHWDKSHHVIALEHLDNVLGIQIENFLKYEDV